MFAPRPSTSKEWRFLILTSVITCSLSLILPLIVPHVEAQGMVPVSEIIDHKVERKTERVKKLSPEKVKAHNMKIASSHLESEDKDHNLNARVSIKDKPLHLQNPDKHAAEEFLLEFLLKQYPRSESVEEKVEILENMENFSHKFENGRDLFKSTTALKDILLPALNSSHAELRKRACGVFAVAAQNNDIVQDSAVEAGVIRHLVHLLTFDDPVRPKALFALTSLLRNFPKAQQSFIQDGGVPALVKVAYMSDTRKRSLNLVSDMLSERRLCRIDQEMENLGNFRPHKLENQLDTTSTTEDDDPCDDFKILETALKESGWCEFLGDIINSIPGFETEDQILTSEAVFSSLSFCEKSIAQYASIFHSLLGKFEKDEDFLSESAVVKDIIRVIDPLASKDEL